MTRRRKRRLTWLRNLLGLTHYVEMRERVSYAWRIGP